MRYLRHGWAVIAVTVIAAMGSAAVARGDAVTQWNINASSAIFAAGPTAHASTLSFAMVQGAVYDAVNGIEGGYQPYLVKPAANQSDSKDAAVATAAYRVLIEVIPSSQTAALATLATQYEAALAAVPEGAAKAGGIAAGEAAAAAMLAARANDGRNPSTPFPFVFGTTAGAWRVSPPLTAPDPQLGSETSNPSSSRTRGWCAPTARTRSRATPTRGLQRGQVARLVREHEPDA